MFLTKNHKFLEFSKSQSWALKIHQFHYEYISVVRCTGERGQMTKLEKVATRHNCNFMRGVFVPLQEQYAEKANMFVKGQLCYISIINFFVSV